MALQREQIEDLTEFPHVKSYLEKRPWVHINKNSKYKKHLKKCMHKIIRRTSIEDTPIGKSNKRPTRGWLY